MTLEVVRLKNEQGQDRTPVIFMEIPGQRPDTVLLYGHLDKQPEMVGWGEGLRPLEAGACAATGCTGAGAPTTATPRSPR